MKQYTENQYDDDLTVGTDDYDDSYYTGSVDLFEFANDEESPISRLKSLILSIDWEITDEILMQFNEELLDLRDIWAGEKINLVYVQALEKISKYIYQKKADSHPSAIKLLLTLYHNLEKIVSSVDLSEAEKREILLEDVKRFESLKRHIGEKPKAVVEEKTVTPKLKKQRKNSDAENPLMNLKATVLSIDWEITDQDLNDLRKEVVRLEKKFAGNRPRLILLQGIGTLCAYIKLKQSNAHADAFKILHLFYDSLEKIVLFPLSLEEEKSILFPAVEQFNSFKLMLGTTIEADAIKRDRMESDEDEVPDETPSIAPAFADIPEEEIKGFQAEEEALALGADNPGNIHNHIDSFFAGEAFNSPDEDTPAGDGGLPADEMGGGVIPGLDVELDDEDEEDLPVSAGDEPAPALSFADAQDDLEPAAALLEDEVVLGEESYPGTEESIGFIAQNEDISGPDFGRLDRETVLQGVAVETEADDDSDEDALPMMGGELAPALAENDEVSIYNAEILEQSSIEDTIEDEISGTLGGFFDAEIEAHLPADSRAEAEPSEQQAPAPGFATADDEDEAVAPAPGLERQDWAEEVFAAAGDTASVEEEFKEIDDHVDTFFGLEAGAEETAEDVPPGVLSGEPVEDIVTVAEDAAPAVFEDTEEEVVFELVDEDEVIFSELSPEGLAPASETDAVPVIFRPLQTCVESIGCPPDDQGVAALLAEIDRLYQVLSDRPLEKTFLRLLSAITRNMDKDRYNLSDRAFVLLSSVCLALTQVQESDLHKRQELLLIETDKVLRWQEELLTQRQ